MKAPFILNFAFFAIISFGNFNAFSQSEITSWTKINQMADSCIYSSLSTADCHICLLEVTDLWKTEMNKYLDSLNASFDAKGRSFLTKSQKEWENYRKNEFNFLDYFYFEFKQGTMYHNTATFKEMIIYKERTMYLFKLFQEIND